MSISEFIASHGLGKYKIVGQEAELGCPFKSCPNHGEPQFYINISTESWYCHRCNRKGNNIKQLQYALGFIKLQEPVETSHIYIPEHDIDEWTKTLFSTEKALVYLKNKRGLENWTIKQFRLGYKTVDNLPVITIPYFDKTDTCVGVKYDYFTRTGKTKYSKARGTKTIFYNLNSIVLDQSLIITEGEYDAIAGYQYGYENIGSIPNGASGINGWTEDIVGGDRYILCFDNDSAGSEGAQKLAKVLGRSYCFRVYPKVKDLSDALQIGVRKEEVKNWFDNKKPMFNPPILDITSYEKDALAILADPLISVGTDTGWRGLNEKLGGIRMKEVTSVSGKTGNGKTTFGVALIGNLIKQDIKCLMISPEMREGKLLLMLANNLFKKQVTPEELKLFEEKNKGKIQLANVYGSWTDEKKDGRMMDYVFDIVEHSVKFFDTKFIFIDHLRLFTTTKSDQERGDVEEFIRRCVRCAMMHDIHIFLVVQPKKLERGQRKVTLEDLKGSANITQDVHNVLLIHREKNSELVEFDVAKNRENGTIGTFHLKFNLKSMVNYEEVTKEK